MNGWRVLSRFWFPDIGIGSMPRVSKNDPRSRRRRRGAALVEMAVVLPLLTRSIPLATKASRRFGARSGADLIDLDHVGAGHARSGAMGRSPADARARRSANRAAGRRAWIAGR